MSTGTHDILLLPLRQNIEAVHKESLLIALARRGIQISSDCGGMGKCGKCLVRLSQTPIETSENSDSAGFQEKQFLDQLACQTEVTSDLTVSIPATSLSRAEVVEKPGFISGWPGEEFTSGNRKEGFNLSLAIDIGTTTIAVYLLDHTSEIILASGVLRNPQILFGDDVMSRIHAVSLSKIHLKDMQHLVIDGINHTVSSIADRCGADIRRIDRVAVVGNPTMIHLFMGDDPSSIGIYPFEPAFTDSRNVPASDIGLNLARDARLDVLPLISGFLGSDIIASTVACSLDNAKPGTMIIDVGTNGEIMVKTEDGLAATSCATGPAFEGASIRHGMHAISGAIESVKIGTSDSTISCKLIQQNSKKPRKAAGICGSGIVSAVSALLKAGVIEPNGRFNPTCDHPHLRRTSMGDVEFVLVSGNETESGADITLTQNDIRAVQLAKGAIFTGITLLCHELNIERPKRMLVAGAFGSHLNREDVITIGLFPNIEIDTIEFVGNAAGKGALLSLLNEKYQRQFDAVSRQTRVVELATHPDFQTTLINALSFPDVQGDWQGNH
jgi:uncharacterized 2Fe-2S/4Fe-4S cluster protein (DUF4445 family)